MVIFHQIWTISHFLHQITRLGPISPVLVKYHQEWQPWQKVRQNVPGLYAVCRQISVSRANRESGLHKDLTFYPTYDLELAFHVRRERVHCLKQTFLLFYSRYKSTDTLVTTDTFIVPYVTVPLQ